MSVYGGKKGFEGHVKATSGERESNGDLRSAYKLRQAGHLTFLSLL